MTEQELNGLVKAFIAVTEDVDPEENIKYLIRTVYKAGQKQEREVCAALIYNQSLAHLYNSEVTETEKERIIELAKSKALKDATEWIMKRSEAL